MERDFTERISARIINSNSIGKVVAALDRLLYRSIGAPAMRRLKIFLNGTWIGHPLHPILTDIPIGAWTFTNLGRFREDSTFSTWVTRIAINEALMLLRQRRTTRRLSVSNNEDVQAPPGLDPADEGPTPEEALAETELRTAVIHAISHLRESLRIVVLLRELQGLTSAETARRLGLTVSAVKARIFHARRYLRQHFVQGHKAARSGFLIGTRTVNVVRRDA